MSRDLVAVDMDGTFLDSAGRYDRPRFERVYARLAERGTTFVVASGNQYWQLKTFFEGFADVWYVAENGSLIGTQHEVLRTFPLPDPALDATLAVLEGLPRVLTVVCGAESAYARIDADPAQLAQMRPYYVRLRQVDAWTRVHEPALKLALLCPPDGTAELLHRLADALPPEVVPTSSGHGSIDLIGRGCTKAEGLAWLGERLGVPAGRMLAFGDGGNDKEMLAFVGRGVAMGQAPADVRAVADEVAASNDEAGVLAYLERLLA